MMFRFFIIIFLVFVVQISFAQTNMNFKAIDKHALKTQKDIENNLPKLVDYLSKKTSNDLEKVRSFYIWLVNNIDYDNAAVKPNAKRINHSNQDVLNRGKAVCQGYSNLFKEMCDLSNIFCEVISGYPKTPRDKPPNLKAANHTWNAVLINGKWVLLDATWGAANGKVQLEDYFLTPPEIFIIDHLPSDPMWQLLNCPISTEIFKKKEESILKRVSNMDFCFNFRDSIQQLLSLPKAEKNLKTAINAYDFNPVEENKKYLGSMYADMINFLSERSFELEQQDSAGAVLELQLQIIETYEKASNYVELYPHQKENLAYTYFNYAVALSRQLPEIEQKNDKLATVDLYKKMLLLFETGKAILSEVPPNILSENGLKQFDDYIEFVRKELKNYQ
jgi:Transglutaminase-like superfamily